MATHPYTPFLPQVKKPAQYVGGEHGQHQKPWESVRARMCLAFPDLYEIGMSHLGYKILYGILNAHPQLLADRAYAPWTDMEAKLREHGEPLRSLESWRPLREFDVVGFSLQYELTYSNVLTMMDLGGIPRWQKDRDDDDPLILCGGPVAMHAEPLAPFIDAFLIGDGEEKTAEILLTWASLKEDGVGRAERLRALAALGGVYVPSLYETALDDTTGFQVVEGPTGDAPFPVQRHIVRDLEKFPFPAEGPVAATETIFDRMSIEVARGCTEGCRFCQAGMIYRPVRERDPETIVQTILTAIEKGGYDEASLTSLSTADYSAIQPLVHRVMKELEGQRVSVSVSSLRAYGLSEGVLDDMKKQRAGGLTFAPEAGTQRMRDVVNKNVTEEQLLETAERVFSRGWIKMKLYFMIGLPTEEDEDVLGIIETGAKTLGVARRVRGRKDARVVVSVSTHVPKPHTPFQWCAMDPYAEILRKQELLQRAAKQTFVKLRMHDSRGSWLEGVLARGDRRLAHVIERAYLAGARFDSWDEQMNLEAWEQAFQDANVDPQLFLGTIPVHARVPWDHIDVGLEEGFLAKEYRKALANRLSPPCGKVAGQFVHPPDMEEHDAQTRRLVCYDCGVACDMSKMRQDRADFLTKLGATKKRLAVVRDDAERQSDLDRRNRLSNDHLEQGPPLRVRIGFAKVGRIAYASHLDLVRLFPRWFRRAKLPIYYSGGYHPKPQMTFSPALGLGIASLSEYVDLKLREQDVDAATLARLEATLRDLAMDGIEVFGVRVLGPRDRGINKLIEEATWVGGIPRSDARDLEGRVARALDGPLVVTRLHKGREKVVDVGKVLRRVAVGEGSETLADAGLIGDLVPIRFTTFLGNDGTAKPTEVIQALLGELPSVRFVREGLWARRGDAQLSLLDLDALRGEVVTQAAAS
ncbi:MAG: TIGR03960 family B12-binding radical SAM protein [Myxococcota bacterium]